jgi:predicted phage tail protein
VKKIFLHGEIGTLFDKEWNLDVDTVEEAVQAIDANSSGFIDFLVREQINGNNYLCLHKSPKEIKTKGDFNKNVISHHQNKIKSSMHIICTADGGFVAGMAAKLFTSTLLQNVFTSVVWGAITQVAMNVLFKPPKPPDQGKAVSTKSFLIKGATNRQAQGIPVPLGYGRLMVGSSNISASMRSFPIPRKSSAGDNALESYSKVTYLDILSEGPIEGFVNKLGGAISGGDIREGIFLNNVQIKNTSSDGDGRLNYILNENEEEDSPVMKKGSDSESVILLPYSSTIIQYDQILYGGSPYRKKNIGNSEGQGFSHSEYYSLKSAEDAGALLFNHFISNYNVKKVIFSFKVELSRSVVEGSDENAKMVIRPNTVNFGIYISNGDDFLSIVDASSGCKYEIQKDSQVSLFKSETISDNLPAIGFSLSGVATSPYQFDIAVELPRIINSIDRSKGFTFKIIKLSAEYDNTAQKSSVGGMDQTRNLQIAHIEEIVANKFLYPHSAMCKISFDSKNFSSVPERSYHLKLKKVLVPSNYDPVAKTYNGAWNGKFKGQYNKLKSLSSISDEFKEWSDNPAWVFYDILHNPRFGLGKYGLNEDFIDKWQLYKIAKYCDELVETDFPVECQNNMPKPFETFNVESTTLGGAKYFSVTIDDGFFELDENNEYKFLDHPENLSSDDKRDIFKSEFGDGESFKGKKMAFFIYQHGYKFETLSEDQIENIKRKSAVREGEVTIQERVILHSDVNSRQVTLLGPSFDEDPSSFKKSGSDRKKIAGACCVQKNHPVVEPRFTTNIYISEKSDALDIINSMSAVFRGMITYASGKIFSTQDSLKSPVMLFNNSNISDSGFLYSGMSKTKRVTAVLVRFNNKDKQFKPDVVYEEDAAAMQKFGFIDHEVMGFGLTSESQARRLAKWILLTGQLEKETIRFTASQEASYLLPGSIFEVCDEMRAGNDKNGRIKAVKNYIEYNFNGNKFESPSKIVVIDKSIRSSPSISFIELTIASGQNKENFETIEIRSGSENNSDDQDAEIDAVTNPQVLKFNGSLDSISLDNSYGFKSRQTVIKNLQFKKSFNVELSSNKIKSFNHGLTDGERIRFSSLGVLPGGISNKYIYQANSVTKHTFEIKKLGSQNNVNIVDIGRDEFLNKGGEHYFIYESEGRLDDALNSIQIGAAYSIKGIIGVKEEFSWSEAEKTSLGLSSQSELGLYKSDFLGMVDPGDEWIFSPTMNWIYVESLKTNISSQDQMWLFEKDIGWFWTNNSIKDSFWYIVSIKKWVNVIFDSDERKFISAFFVYDDTPINKGDIYTLGESKKMPVIEVVSNGFFLSLTEFIDLQDFVIQQLGQAAQESIIDFDSNPGLMKSDIKEFHAIDATNSIQGENSVVIEFFPENNLNLKLNNELTLQGVNSASSEFNALINKEFSIIYISESSVEIVDSSGLYDSLRTIDISDFTILPDGSGIGSASYVRRPAVSAERKLESQLFRTLSVKETSKNEFEVTGLEYNPSKFRYVDKKGVIRKPRSPIPPQADMNIPDAPKNLILTSLV